MKELCLFDKLLEVSRIDMDNLEYDERFEWLLSSVKKHKLQPYFKKILKAENQQIEEQLESIVEHYTVSSSFLVELQQNIKRPLVVVKGFTNFHLGNGHILLRGTSDIDLLSHNSFEVQEILIGEGFTEMKGETGHELSELRKGNILVDLHKFVPVVSYPEGIDEISIENDMRTKEGLLFTGEIYYDDIIEHSVEVFNNILIPNVNMSLIILCASMFRDYVTSIDEVPTFKLINLIEAYLLIQQPQFDIYIFHELSKRYHAGHSVEFVNCLLKEIYDVSIIEIEPNLEQFPQIHIWNFHKWFIPKNIINTVYNTSFESVLIYLGATTIRLEKGNQFDVDLFKNVEMKIHSNYIAKDNIIKQINLKINWEKELQVQICLKDIEDINEKDIINFNFGKYVKKITICGSAKREDDYSDGNSIASMFYDSEERVVVASFIIPNKEISEYLLDNGKLGMNIYIEKHESENEINCLIPILIVRNEENN